MKYIVLIVIGAISAIVGRIILNKINNKHGNKVMKSSPIRGFVTTFLMILWQWISLIFLNQKEAV